MYIYFREKRVQEHLKRVYGTLSVSMLSAAAGAYMHLYMRFAIVSKQLVFEFCRSLLTFFIYFQNLHVVLIIAKGCNCLFVTKDCCINWSSAYKVLRKWARDSVFFTHHTCSRWIVLALFFFSSGELSYIFWFHWIDAMASKYKALQTNRGNEIWNLPGLYFSYRYVTTCIKEQSVYKPSFCSGVLVLNKQKSYSTNFDIVKG